VKKSDWALIVLIVAVIGTAAYFIVNAIVPPPTKNLETVKTAEAITDAVEEPNADTFGDGSINPTVKLKVGEQGDQQPFSLGRD
jgi:hypothetical protein